MPYLLNAFSLNMLAVFPCQPLFEEISLDESRTLLTAGFQSAVGHVDTANVYANTLGIDVPVQRVNVTLKQGDVAIVGQYRGPRLPEGATTLPDGASILWLRVTV